MEVEDVSHVGQWVQLLETQKAALQVASRRKGERPRDRKALDQLVREFMISRMQIQHMSIQRNHTLHHSFIPPPYLPSVASLIDLQQIYIKDLRLQIHHRGCYLLLRAATPSNVMTAVMAIMEDAVGGGIMLQLYQQKGDAYRPADEIIQSGNVCIVKEPYFKVMNDGGYGLRVDHVSDILWLALNDDRVPLAWQPRVSELKDAEKLKEDGNAALKAGKLHKAVEIYSQGLHSSTTAEASRIIELNRSLAYLRLGCYDQALGDLGHSTSEQQKSEKALYRAARSLYELGKFGEARDMLNSLLAEYPHCDAAKKELSRTNLRLKEYESGDYDFKTMYNAAKATPPYMDLATYIGPVEIKSSVGRGRGLFTTRDVAAGELLLCEKAFAYCFTDASDNTNTSSTSLLMNTHTNKAFMGAQAELITVIVQKLRQNPSLMPAYTSLHHGGYKPVKETQIDGAPIIDTFLIDRIMSLNVFGCPRTTRESHFQTLAQQKKEGKAFHTCGIFINASYINHGCYSNARRSFIGDMQIVRASRNLPADSELFFWYAIPNHELSYEKTQEKFQNWGFNCTCVMCEEHKNTKNAVLKKRSALLQDLTDAFGSRSGADLPKAERVLAALEKTYSVPAATVPRLALWDPYLLLARLYNSNNQQDKVVLTAWKVLEALGFVIERQNPASAGSAFEVVQWGLMQDFVVEAWVLLWAAFSKVASELCERAEECAKTAYRICVGEDVTFDERYGKMAQQAMFEGLDLGQAFAAMTIG